MRFAVLDAPWFPWMQRSVHHEDNDGFAKSPKLKIPAASCRESSTVRNAVFLWFARLPRRKRRGMRSLSRFKARKCCGVRRT